MTASASSARAATRRWPWRSGRADLRYVAGLTTGEIAAAFLTEEPTLAQRLARAKRKIRASGIRSRCRPRPRSPAGSLRCRRSSTWSSTRDMRRAAGPAAARRSVRRGHLARPGVHRLVPADTETAGLLALMLLTHSHAAARLDADGRTVLLAEQDRGAWDHALIAEGTAVLEAAVARLAPGPYQLQAAIAACTRPRRRSSRPTGCRSPRCTASCHVGHHHRLSRSTVLSLSASPTGRLPDLPCSSPSLRPASSTLTAGCTSARRLARAGRSGGRRGRRPGARYRDHRERPASRPSHPPRHKPGQRLVLAQSAAAMASSSRRQRTSMLSSQVPGADQRETARPWGTSSLAVPDYGPQ